MSGNDRSDNSASALAQLVRVRARMIWSLSASLFLLFLGSVYLMTVGTDLAETPIGTGSAINVGIVYTSALTIISACVTAFYAIWANRTLDPLIASANDERAADASVAAASEAEE